MSADEPPTDSPPRRLVIAVEELVDDYGLDTVRAAVEELTDWYANVE